MSRQDIIHRLKLLIEELGHVINMYPESENDRIKRHQARLLRQKLQSRLVAVS